MKEWKGKELLKDKVSSIIVQKLIKKSHVWDVLKNKEGKRTSKNISNIWDEMDLKKKERKKQNF